MRFADLFKRLIGAAAILALASCASVDGDRPTFTSTPLPPPSSSGQDEGPRVPPQVARDYGNHYPAPEIERRLAAILARLVPASERPDPRYSVTILNSPSINAFALPDGQLFVTRGLLALVNDEAEIAAVLAHEMAHVVARHAARRVEASQNLLLGTRVLAVLSGDPRAERQAVMAGATTLASFSRQQEIEADVIGIRNAHRAGFDPYGAARLLESMDRFGALRWPNARRGGGTEEVGFLSTHPTTPERLAQAVAAARSLAGPDIGARDRDAFLQAIDGMTYGDDPRSGLVRGRTYLHPGFGFTFVAPPDFTLENTSRAVIGVAGDGRALRFDTIRVPRETPLAEALSSSATPDLAIGDVSSLEISGFPAATGIGRSPGWAFRFVLIRFGEDVYRFIFAARELDAENDRAFLAAARTFRRLSPEDIAAIKPHRLRVVTVAPGDTVERMVQRMAPEYRQTERFLVLNGMARPGPLRPGTRVKIVTE